MHPYLIRLGIPLVVQDFFRPYMQTDNGGNLLFNYWDGFEHYGMAYHSVPASDHYWTAGDPLLCREVIITGSAMEAIAYLTLHRHRYPAMDSLLFLSTGNRINMPQLNQIRRYSKGKTCTLVFENSLLGHIADLKIAAGIRKIPVAVFAEPGACLRIRFRLRDYWFDGDDFKLSRFEKVAGFRFAIHTAKSISALTFLHQLKAGPCIPDL
jgi:hypothetical protein